MRFLEKLISRFQKKDIKSTEVEDVFRLEEKKFRVLFEKSPVGMVLITADGRYIDANQAYLDMIGYAAAELFKFNFWDAVSKEYVTRGKEYVHLIRETGAYGPCETECMHKSGRSVPILLNGALIKSGAGDDYLLLILQDITERKRSEAMLLESIGDGVAAIDRQWNIISWNRSAALISGWAKEEVLGKPLRSFLKFVRERDRAENIEFIERVLITGEKQDMEDHTVLVRKDGKEIPVGDSAAPVFDASSKIIGAIIIFRDISKERESYQLRSDFAYASHQLRTPVTQALWSVEVALETKDREEIGKNLENAYRSMESVVKLMEQLLEVSEIDQKMAIPKIEGVKLTTIFDKLIEFIKKPAKRQKVDLEVSPISATVAIAIDQKLLVRSLFEILDNAIYYSPAKSKITVDIKIQEKDLLITIQDSGIGIPSEQQPLIFTKFFRGSNFDKNQIPGAGLGLFIAKEYIKLLKGKIWFKSEENKGTTFFVQLPIT